MAARTVNDKPDGCKLLTAASARRTKGVRETYSMTDLTYLRDAPDFEQMADAQHQCVPCKLCGGKAVIYDAGVGAGYYIRCENHGAFRAAMRCLVGDNRLGGWAYNVAAWWNRLHAEVKDA